MRVANDSQVRLVDSDRVGDRPPFAAEWASLRLLSVATAGIAMRVSVA